MLYSAEIVIPAETLKIAPLATQLDVVAGVVKRVWVRWRWGSANLCGCRISRWGSQLWPRTLNQWFPSCLFDTTFEESYTIPNEPLEFVVDAYNIDDTYPHTLWIGVLVLQPSINSNISAFLEYLAAGGVPWPT